MNMRTMFLALLIGVAVINVPAAAHAQTADQLRAQIAELLAQIYTLRAQLTGTDGTTVPTSTETLPVNTDATFKYSRCPNLQYNLEPGDTDAEVAVEVTMLQRFLAQDPQLYPEGLITGYFGPATERALQRFQTRHGIVTYGDPQSTGYGRAGPRTRHAIKNSCGTVGAYDFAASPLAGSAPLEVRVSFEYSGSTCTSYELDWGDGSNPSSHQAISASSCANDTVRKEFAHVYVGSGVYSLTLRIGKGSVLTLPIVGQTNIVVQGGVVGGSSKAQLTLSPSTGSAPLTTYATLEATTPASCTSYEIDWGDGTQLTRRDMSSYTCTSSNTFTQQFAHTYQSEGTYTLRARAGRGAIPNLNSITQQIVVGEGSGTGCFIQPTSGAAPFAARARILFGGTLCDGTLTYAVDWGDGTVSPERACFDQNTHYEQLTHTYTNPGTYTARLQQQHPNARFSEQTCAVTVNSTSANNTSGGYISSLCRSWTDGCNTCSRSYVGGPASCTQQSCYQYGTQQCYQYFNGNNSGGDVSIDRDSLSYRVINSSTRTVEFTALINAARECNGGVYTIYFGDGTDNLQPYPADACQLFTRTVTHTYNQNGTYTAYLLKDGVTVYQVTFTVSSSSSRAGSSNVASVIEAIERFIKKLFR